ncbi:hypothetical protein DUI37_28450 [Bacillus anthracis]|nr:hypothetical protein DUI37_28450 [Bacillus anthracis]
MAGFLKTKPAYDFVLAFKKKGSNSIYPHPHNTSGKRTGEGRGGEEGRTRGAAGPLKKKKKKTHVITHTYIHKEQNFSVPYHWK